MARKSQRVSSSSVAATPTHKRAASGSEPLSSAATQRSKKLKATPTQSQYFHADPAGDNFDVDGEDVMTTSPSADDDDASEFGANEEVQISPSSEGEDNHEDYDSGSDEAPKKRKKPTPSKGTTSTAAIRTKGSELWRPGVKTGLGPGTQVVIKKPKARGAGKTPYEDDTIHPNTILFLKDLKANNDREWLKMNDADFRQAEKDWYGLVDKITERLTEIDDTIPELPVKDVIFRIYRDIRFSKDPTPYKSRTGRKGPYAAYYVQIGPDSSFVGGGLWHPEAAPIAALRSDIDRHPRNIKDVLQDAGMRKEFLGGIPKNDTKAVKAFVSNNSENALKTRPKGFDADHPDIALLRLRNYTVGRKLEKDEVVGPHGLDNISRLLSCMKPFVTYLNSIVMPDNPVSDEEVGSDSEGSVADQGDEGEASSSLSDADE